MHSTGLPLSRFAECASLASKHEALGRRLEILPLLAYELGFPLIDLAVLQGAFRYRVQEFRELLQYLLCCPQELEVIMYLEL